MKVDLPADVLFDFDKADFGLVPAHCDVWQGFIFINLGQSPEPFDTVYAPLMGRFDRFNLGGPNMAIDAACGSSASITARDASASR